MLSTNPIAYAVERIMTLGIDKTILQLAFGGINHLGINKNISYELDKLISKHVCNDFNLISGEIIDIKVGDCKIVENSEGRVYIVPPEARRNRDIREVHGIKRYATHANVDANLNMTALSSSSFINSMNSALGAMNTNMPTGVTNVELEDNNMIRVTTSNGSLYGYDLFVTEIENRDKLRRLKRGSYMAFSKIAIAFVKSYIYSNSISILKGSLHAGHELSEISSVISNYSGAQEEYETYMSEKAPKMLTFSDEAKLNSLYQRLI